MIAALSTWHKLGLLAVGLLFIGFALVSAFVLPRRSPNFPGRRLGLYLLACVTLFAGMLAAVVVFGAESGEAKGGESTSAGTAPATTASGKTPKTVKVSEREFKIQLASGKLAAGTYEFEVANDGKIPHNLTISGPGADNAATATIGGGKTAKLTATLAPGTYELYCSVPGHKQAGMDLKVTVS